MSALEHAIRRWMFDVALPFWGSSGVEAGTGLFVERFSMGGQPHLDTRRVFVICRQIYVFCHAAELGWSRGDALAERGCELLRRDAWLGPERGWARALARDGSVIDPTPDLYVQAFVLFALAWFYRRSRDPSVIADIERTFEFLLRHMRHPGGVGFVHEQGDAAPRLQNPHMHLAEAALAVVEFCGLPQGRVLADEMTDLLQHRFLDERTGTLAEYFDDHFHRLQTPAGQVTEPGHQFEWAWILSHYQRLTGTDVSTTVATLVDSAERYGVDPLDKRTYNAVRDDGRVLDAGSRVWPNTERIKAAVAMHDICGKNALPAITQSARLLFDRYLAREPAGTWIDAFDADGNVAVDRVPTSTFYHIFLAFAEVLRILAPQHD